MGSQMSKEISTDQSNLPTNTISSKKIDIKSLGKTNSSIGNIFNDNSSYNGIIYDKSKFSNNGQLSNENSFLMKTKKN
jgi:hypothetical protein